MINYQGDKTIDKTNHAPHESEDRLLFTKKYVEYHCTGG